MRILHIDTEKTWRGGERQVFWLARELAGRGHRIWMACRPGFPLESRCREAGLEVFPFAPLTEADPFAAVRLRRFCRRNAVEILHAHTGAAVGMAALASLGSGTLLVSTRRVDFPLRDGWFTRWKYRRMDAVAVISGKVGDVIRKAGLPEERIRLIPSGTDPSESPDASQREELRSCRGLSAAGKIVVNAAALVPHKDQATLLRAARLVCDALPSVRFLILGEGPLMTSLKSLAADLGLKDHVFFLGHRSDVGEYIALADVFVMSSSEEGLGTVLLDAMNAGVPTAATSAGGIPDLYGEEGFSCLSPPGSPGDLANSIMRVLEDESEARLRVEHGRRRAALFTVSGMTARYERLYGSLSRE